MGHSFFIVFFAIGKQNDRRGIDHAADEPGHVNHGRGIPVKIQIDETQQAQHGNADKVIEIGFKNHLHHFDLVFFSAVKVIPQPHIDQTTEADEIVHGVDGVAGFVNGALLFLIVDKAVKDHVVIDHGHHGENPHHQHQRDIEKGNAVKGGDHLVVGNFLGQAFKFHDDENKHAQYKQRLQVFF